MGYVERSIKQPDWLAILHQNRVHDATETLRLALAKCGGVAVAQNLLQNSTLLNYPPEIVLLACDELGVRQFCDKNVSFWVLPSPPKRQRRSTTRKRSPKV
jgi:hypothetical protein